MSLLNFLFKDKADHAEPEVAAEAAAQVPAEVEDATEMIYPPSVPSPSVSNRKLDLDEIREALNKIAEIISDDDEQERQREVDAGNFTTLSLSVGTIAELAPQAFRDAAQAAGMSDTVDALISDLFEQLGSGKVTTTLGHLAGNVSEDLLIPDFENHRGDSVDVPLNLAVTAVQPDELMKRTATAERDDGLADMPNLFNAPSPSSSVAESDAITDEDEEDYEAETRMIDPAVIQAATEALALQADAKVPAMDTPVVDEPAVDAQPVEEEPAAAEAEPDVEDDVEDVAAAAIDDDPVFGRVNAPQNVITGLSAPSGRMPFASDTPIEEPRVEESHVEEAHVEESHVEESQVEEPRVEEAASAPTFDIDPSVDVFNMATPEEASPAPDVVPVAPVVPASAEEDAAPLSEDAPAVAASGNVVLKGVDLNQATEADLIERLDGVGTRLAERIVKFRERNHGFKSVADLTRVPGVGPSTYEKITGGSWSEARDSVKRTLDFLFGTDQNEMPDLRQVAARFTELPGFSGCIVTHADGHILAANWDHPSQEMLGAVAPQMCKKVGGYAEQLDMGEVNPISLVLGDEMVTIVESGDLFLVLIHSTARINKRQIGLIQLAGAELEHRLEKFKMSV